MMKIRFSNFGTTCSTGIVNHPGEDQTDELKACINQAMKKRYFYERKIKNH